MSAERVPPAQPSGRRSSGALAAQLGVPRALQRYSRDLQRWRAGNSIRLLRGGAETFPAMVAAIEAATRSVCLETYIIDDDRTGRRITDALCARARAGVTVRLLYDAVGGWGMASSFVDRLREAGVEVVEFHPIAPWRRRWGLSRRDHRKILVVDDEVGFTGGLNLSDDYAATADGGRGWHDIHCELRGPVVADLGRLFRRTWLYAHGRPYPAPPDASTVAGIAGGATFARVLDNAFRRRRRVIRRAYLAAINAAEEDVLLANAYFLPDRGLRAAMRRAVARGVAVRVIVPGRSDVALVELAGLYLYHRLARAGVEILRWRGPMMHAKAAVVDGVWSTIGSYNLDSISLLRNLEVTVETLDPAHGAVMRAQHQADRANCVRFDAAAWRALSWWRRAASWLAYQFERWL